MGYMDKAHVYYYSCFSCGTVATRHSKPKDIVLCQSCLTKLKEIEKQGFLSQVAQPRMV